MPLPLLILAVVLLAASVALAVFWSVVIYHIARTLRAIPTCRDGLALPEAEALRKSAPSLCVIVPAHNEEGVIGKLARSLMTQSYPNLSVVFALDRCTDQTAEEIRTATGGCDHVTLLHIDACPPDWAGKVHAVTRAVRDSAAAHAAELLLFADADTELDPHCLRAAVALLQNRRVGLLSLMSTLTCDPPFERIAQTPAGMELMRQYPLLRANSRTGHGRRAFANGQFMLFTRAAYETIGGHEAVRDAVLEDIALARLIERRGIPASLHFADNMLRCRMYATREEFDRGWKRIFSEACNLRVKRLRSSARRLRTIGSLLPFAAMSAIVLGAPLPHDPLALATGIAGAIGLLAMLSALIWSYRISHAPPWCILAYPLGAWQVGCILNSAAQDLIDRKPIRWAGREYIREPR